MEKKRILEIKIPPEYRPVLEARAKEAGQTLEEYASKVLEEAIAFGDTNKFFRDKFGDDDNLALPS